MGRFTVIDMIKIIVELVGQVIEKE